MKLVTILFSLLLLTATKECGSDKTADASEMKKEITEGMSGNYDVTIVGDNDYSEYDITMNIDMGKENKISGKSACNNYSGSFKNPKENQVEMGMMMSTKMYCKETSKIESDYLNHLSKVASVNPTKDGMELMNKEGEVIIVAVKQKQ